MSTPKSYGKALHPSGSSLPQGITRFFPLAPQGLPASLLVQVLEDILLSLREIAGALSQTEARFVGMSVLVVYEGDASVLEQALKEEAEQVESGVMEDDDDDDGDSSEEGWGEGGDEEKGQKGRGERAGTTLVKLIDFAHSRAATGKGRDESVMKGMETAVRLVQGRLEEVRREGKYLG